MSRLIYLISFICFGHSLVAAVMAPAKRDERIAAVQALFPHFNDQSYDALEKCPNVFLRVSQAEIAKELVDDSEPPVEEKVVALSDRDILEMVARQLNPTGSLVFGNRRLLVLEGGKRLPMGMQIPVRIKGELHKILLQSVQSDHFIISLNGETLKKVFNDDKLTGSLQFD